MFLQPVTKFFIGSFLEGMDGPLGYRQFGICKMVTGLKRMVLILPVNGSKALVITEESG